MTDMTSVRIFFICMILTYGYSFDNKIKPSCPADVEMCEFHWTIDYFQTMTLIPSDGKGPRLSIESINGTLYIKTSCGSVENMQKGE